MMTLLLETPVMIRDADHVRLREWLAHLPPRQRTPYLDALRRKLSEADVIERTAVPRDLVTMNSLVGLRDLTTDEKLTCILVYPDEANVVQRKVSVAVPLGTEMLGRQVGTTLHCPVSTGVRPIRIERVYYQPEAAGDYHR
jgi:regulator of nucleoside diphosphate kinase